MSGRAQKESCCHHYWRLVDSGEPFRLLFPLGALLGVAGVSIWPLHVWGFVPLYPGQIHARIMIEGFFTAFAMGFLGTAFPRVLDVRRLGMAASIPLAVALLVCASLHLTGRILGGDVVFFATLATFVAILLSRARERKDFPPPSFVLVAMGVLSGLTGADIGVDDAMGQVTVTIPHASLAYVTVDVEKTEFEETKKALFAFGEIKLTNEQLNLLEQSIRDAMEKQLSSADMLAKADVHALEQVRALFEPIVRSVAPDYIVTVQFAS